MQTEQWLEINRDLYTEELHSIFRLIHGVMRFQMQHNISNNQCDRISSCIAVRNPGSVKTMTLSSKAYISELSLQHTYEHTSLSLLQKLMLHFQYVIIFWVLYPSQV